jgi:hypothetical protein
MTRKYDESNNASLVLPRLGAIITKILMETKQKKCERKQHYCVSSSQSVTVEGVTRLMFEFCVSPRYRGGGGDKARSIGGRLDLAARLTHVRQAQSVVSSLPEITPRGATQSEKDGILSKTQTKNA